MFEERKTFRHISQENDERICCRNGAISLETNRRIKSNFATSALFIHIRLKAYRRRVVINQVLELSTL